MTGRTRPLRFPIVDKTTGESDVPVETPDTVQAAERPALEVSGLTTHFEIRGETLSLVGESGCGKSTAGRSVMRLIQPHSGSVLPDGVDAMTLDQNDLREQRKRMQIIFRTPLPRSIRACLSARPSPNRC